MRLLLLAGACFFALSSPVLAQDPQGDTPIDSLVEVAPPQAPEAKPTGNPVLDRLAALEARVHQLEARNADLEQQAELNQSRLETVETRAAKAAQFTWAPTIADQSGNFSFMPRGVIDADAIAFIEHRGG